MSYFWEAVAKKYCPGSMQEDIQQVRNIVRELSSPANEVGEEEFDLGSDFYTFLLAPFKDPGNYMHLPSSSFQGSW